MKFVSILLITLCCTACSTTHFIVINNDNSATITAERTLDNSLENSLYSSSIVSNIDTSGTGVSFRITELDSIGNYMPHHQKGFLLVHKEGDLVTISDGHTDAFKAPEIKRCCHLYLQISAEKEITSVETTHKIMSHKKRKNTLTIGRGNGKQRKGEENLSLTFKLKD